MTRDRVEVDVAGAFVGGARRFLHELDDWARQHPSQAPNIVGRGVSLTPAWLARRELEMSRRARRVALNNASVVAPGGARVVLLRNALHFASEQEFRELQFTPSRQLRAQIPVIRLLARRADEVVVPCQAMADRVLRYVPGVASRLVVRPHPLSARPWAGSPSSAGTMLMPIVPSPYKRLPLHVARILRIAKEAGLERLVLTASPMDFPPEVRESDLVEFVGVLDAPALDEQFRAATCTYFPTQIEAFGYPLAEARVNGRAVVALNTQQNREIAAQALAPFDLGSDESLAQAVHHALHVPVVAEPLALSPDQYFPWLFDLGDIR